MKFLDSAEIDHVLDYSSVIAALRKGFVQSVTTPKRHHHDIERADNADATLLLMPAWAGERAFGVKIASVFPGNEAKNLPSVQGVYVLCDGDSGKPLAVLDGTRLTQWRTAAASALASSFLAKSDARSMVMVGAGALAPELIKAHSAIAPIERVLIWNRNRKRAERVARDLRAEGNEIVAVDDLETAVRGADLISCATMSTEPLVKGSWLAPGCHLDLVGAFKPTMRETDEEVFRYSSLFVDTREGVLAEAGDILQAIDAGALAAEDIVADLAELARGDHQGRSASNEITVFKSVGTALEDLITAELVWQRHASLSRQG